MIDEPFHLFDPEQEVCIAERTLPHWFQPGITYFITFRTNDSLPAVVLERWLEERARWLSKRGIDGEDWKRQLQQLPQSVQREFHTTFTSAFERLLDTGYGECVLKRPELAQIVARSLLHFDGDRYQMSDFVVMPNHGHFLVGLLGETRLDAQCYSWKKFTAAQINARLGRKGHFWQGESFDHAVRSPEQFAHFQNYIATNPTKASLHEGDYLLYRRH
jgi:type I restriction enzyme R subunit